MVSLIRYIKSARKTLKMQSEQELSRRADLHVHTNFSDGTFSPKEVVEYANKIGLAAIAITDHDSVEGISPAVKAAEDKSLEIIPGLEFTTEIENCEVHILGFFIDYGKKWFTQELLRLRQMRHIRMQKMLECLSKKGIGISMDEVRLVSGEGSIGRLHLAKLLFEKGHVSSVKNAFDKFIGNGKPCYAGGDRISPIDAIAMVIKAGGVPVLAHPHTMGKDKFISSFVKAGLRGIEVYHSDHAQASVNHYKKIAQEFELLITGGSDCHGMGKGKVMMGTVTVPYEIVEQLKNAR